MSVCERRCLNPLTPNDLYMSRTAPLTSKRCILYIYSTNVGTEYFKHALYSPFFPLQNAVCFIMLTSLAPVLFTFYKQGVLKLKKKKSGAKGLTKKEANSRPQNGVLCICSILSVFFFSSKCSLFHNANFFGSCIIHILYTGVLKLKKKKFRRQRVKYLYRTAV